MKLVLLAALVTLCVLVVVSADGYGGGGYQTYMVPGGGGKRGRKWQIRAKGKGLQNMMPHYQHSGGGEKHYEKKPKEIVYYPVPIYTPMHEEHHDYYKKEDEHKINVIPIHAGGYGHMGGGYGHMFGGGYGGHGLEGLLGGYGGYKPY